MKKNTNQKSNQQQAPAQKAAPVQQPAAPLQQPAAPQYSYTSNLTSRNGVQHWNNLADWAVKIGSVGYMLYDKPAFGLFSLSTLAAAAIFTVANVTIRTLSKKAGRLLTNVIPEEKNDQFGYPPTQPPLKWRGFVMGAVLTGAAITVIDPKIEREVLPPIQDFIKAMPGITIKKADTWAPNRNKKSDETTVNFYQEQKEAITAKHSAPVPTKENPYANESCAYEHN